MAKTEFTRPTAEDGYPISGLAKIAEVVVASGLSRSKVYSMLMTGELPSVSFGKSRRVPWSAVRAMFLSPSVLVSADGR